MKAMLVAVEWDEGNWPKCGKHGLSRSDIEGFFASGPAVRGDPHDAERRFRAIGPIASGRHLFVVFTLRERDGITYIRPVSARFMHRKEVQRYEQDNPETAPILRH